MAVGLRRVAKHLPALKRASNTGDAANREKSPAKRATRNVE